MKTICFFASYYTVDIIPYCTKVYVTELKKHFSKIVLLSSKSLTAPEDIDFIKNEGIEFQFEKNEGFDFGMWYKAFQAFDLNDYDQVALVNDSCVLFKPLNDFIGWSNINDADVKGMTLSEAISPHIQSYFMLLNKKAISLTQSYFERHKILGDIADVIETYEVGLGRYFIDSGLKIAAFVDNNCYKGEFSPYYYCVNYHLSKGIPLIKKKILFSSYRKDELMNLARMGFNIDSDYYYKILINNKDLVIDLDKLKIENKSILTLSGKIKYNTIKFLIKLFRPLYKLFK